MSTLAMHSSLYKEHHGVDSLSKTFQSSAVFTPSYVDRPTIQEENYHRYRLSTARTPKTLWGRSFSYGLGSISLPSGRRSKWEPPIRVQKGHQHYGSGVMPHPRGLPIQQYYMITQLSKSKVRSSDQLQPKPTEEDLGKTQVTKPFPAEHPYASHIGRYSLFPSYDSPDDIHKGKPAVDSQPTLSAKSPANPPESTVVAKTKGTPARHEIVKPPRSSERKPLEFREGPNYHQVTKGPDKEKQKFYPSPTSTVRPATNARLPDMALTPKTANALHNLQKTHWVTTYQSTYTGNGSNNVYKLDNYEDIVSGQSNDELTLKSNNTFQPSRATEGRKVKENHKTESSPTPSNDMNSVIADQPKDINNNAHSSENGLQKSPDSAGSNTKLSKPFEPIRSGKSYRSPPRSVKFSRSVSFSDGISIREIPMNDENKENRLFPHQTFPRTPFPGARRGINRPSSAFQTPTFYNQPEKTPVTSSTDPAVSPKYFRGRSATGRNSSSDVVEAQNWSRSEMHRKFHESFPEGAPDLRRKPDTRVTTNERRHVIPETGAHTYYFRGTDRMLP